MGEVASTQVVAGIKVKRELDLRVIQYKGTDART